ncbi:1-acyl-sn-glycerol-3-phosphate acyltransferase [Rhodosalinus halophilus]|uniref:1-acyl-sn-glycerol-3-phosphate acyltransferase n=1 Tax=Rhodosalinus halophilus TaxID=2259333 RepID=A0A365U4N7_9RHOB|nr:lysophospholipid acyltransferase family protein [Rhodosalinus halophilus]RBI83210.1 1-acyl-sn-glycerol-3-phosphate acyltransferase [Rhodosalinus halophilus]
MSRTWRGAAPPAPEPIGPAGWLRAAATGLPLALVVFGGLAVLLLLRVPERLVWGARRPVTPWITLGVCRAALPLLGVRLVIRGAPIRGAGAMVANHASWADIFALNACTPLYFVAKAEVAGWPGIGWLARATGTLFIARDRRAARLQREAFAERLRLGHRLLFFPEGTSTDGRRVLRFVPTLFDAFYDDGLDGLRIQPVTVAWHAPPGRDARFYGWWGDMAFGPHLLQVLAAPGRGRVEVIWHAPLDVAGHAGRKALAQALEARVREGLEAALSPSRP